MVQKQHSKTNRLFTLKKSETSESSNIIQRIASPLGRFHNRTSTGTEENSEKQEQNISESNGKTYSIGSTKKRKRKPKKSLHKLASDKNQDDNALPDFSGYLKAHADSSIDSIECNGDKDKEKESLKLELSTSETSDSVSISESSAQTHRDVPKIKNLFRRSLMIMPSKEETPRLSSPEKNIENARKTFLRGLNEVARKSVRL